MATAESSFCSISLCQRPSVGVGLRSRVQLCEEHLQSDLKKAQQLTAAVKQKLHSEIQDSLSCGEVRDLQCLLAGEAEEMQKNIDKAHKMLDLLEQRMRMSLEKKSHLARAYTQRLSELEQYRKEMERVGEQGDVQSEFNLAILVDLMLDSPVEPELLKMTDANKKGAKSAGEVDIFDFSRKATGLEFLCISDELWWSLYGTEARKMGEFCSPDLELLCEAEQSRIENLGGSVTWITACTNTIGFAGKSGRVIKCISGDSVVALPQPCLFAAFQVSDSKDHLMVTSLDGATKLRCNCEVDWKAGITGLHCDSNRQLLFIAQPQAIVVTGLCGIRCRTIDSHSIGLPIRLINGIDGDADKVFVFDLRRKVLLGMSKESGELETTISVDGVHGGGNTFCSIAVFDNYIFLTDKENGKVHRISRIAKKCILSYPNRLSDSTDLKTPIDVACLPRGIVVVSQNRENSLVSFTSCGFELNRFRTDASHGTWGLTVVDYADQRLLVVADNNNSRLRVLRVQL